MEDKIKIIKCDVHKIATEKEIENSLDSLQREVKGYIEVFTIAPDICLICNEEGKIRNMPINRSVRDENGKVIEVIAGDFIICGSNEEGDFRSLTQDELSKYKEMFKYPEEVLLINNEVFATPYNPNSMVINNDLERS